MVNVAVIDDGIGSGFYGIGKISNSIEVTSNLTIQNVSIYNNSHGTICAAIIKRYYKEAMLFSIKILNEKSHKCKKEQLITAIEWCINNDIQVINLSIGTIDYREFEPIKEIINKAYTEGLIIVAACNNRDIFTYPASYTNVIGVKCCKINKLNEGEYIFNLYPIDGIEITSCSEHKLYKENLELEVSNICNSYAAPMITAKICEMIDKNSFISLGEIRQQLYMHSINYTTSISEINNLKDIDWIGTAAVVDINKKEDMIKLSYSNKISTFKDPDAIDINKFDTLILLDNTLIYDYNKLKFIIYEFEKKLKNIIVISTAYQDTGHEYKYKNSSIKYWRNSIIKKFYQQSLLKKKIDVPLVIVYDYTKDKLMKLLKILTDKFREDGYYAGGICTNPTSVLHMLEYIPLGNGRDFTGIKDKLESLYRVYDYDIIILGLTIYKEDKIKIKDINISLNPDKTIFLLNKFTYETKKYIEKVSIDTPLIIINKANIDKYTSSGYKVFSYKDLDLFYKSILAIFISEN